MRYWRHNSDGSYVICLDSTIHPDCPLVPGVVRADFHGAYLISPPKEEDYDEDQVECLVTLICQIDPKGWIWKSFNYQHMFLEKVSFFSLSFLVHVRYFVYVIENSDRM